MQQADGLLGWWVGLLLSKRSGRDRAMDIFKARAPMRLSFFGGGTDVSPYADEHGGKVLNCTIDKYVHCMFRPVDGESVVVVSLDLEVVSKLGTGKGWDGKLALPQAVVNELGAAARGCEILMYSDVPPGSGLGSSSALVVSMIELLNAASGLQLTRFQIAEQAYKIERIDLGIPGGRQDQYAAVFGGMNVFEFHGPRVEVRPIKLHRSAMLELESSLVLALVGDRQHLSSRIIEDQVRRVRTGETLHYYDALKELVDEAVKLLLDGRIADFGCLLHDEWQLKKSLSPRISSPWIDEVYEMARRSGALGGKLSGAGGGGFVVFACPFEERLRLERRLSEAGVRVVPFSFVAEGVHSWRVPMRGNYTYGKGGKETNDGSKGRAYAE